MGILGEGEKSPVDRARKDGMAEQGWQEEGFSLVEMIVAMFILAMIIGMVLLLGAQMALITAVSHSRDVATTLAQSKIEELRSLSSLSPGSVTDIPQSGYQRTTSISTGTPSYLFQIQVTVSSTPNNVVSVVLETSINTRSSISP